MKAEPRDHINPSWIVKYRPESHCDGRETFARLDSTSWAHSWPPALVVRMYILDSWYASDSHLSIKIFSRVANMRSVR